eukprot:gene2110-2519_t
MNANSGQGNATSSSIVKPSQKILISTHTYIVLYYNKAVCYLKLKKYNEAYDSFQVVLKHDYNHIQSHAALGTLLLSTIDVGNPDDPTKTSVNGYDTPEEDGEDVGRDRHRSSGTKNTTDHQPIHITLSNLPYSSKEELAKKALSSLSIAYAATKSQDADIAYNMGIANVYLQNLREALRYFNIAESIDPTHPQVKGALESCLLQLQQQQPLPNGWRSDRGTGGERSPVEP